MVLDELKKVDLREEWADEETDFTPWMAANIEKIEEVLGMELEVKDTEKSVGSFKADILAEETNTEKEIVIENQLGKSDHKHLGQLITYGSGIEAFTVVWICRTLKDEHRKAIDWLNESTRKDTNFFALEVELYKIGDSNPAPKFDVVSEPNEWSRRVKSETESLSPVEKLRQSYWTEFRSHMEESNPPFPLRNPWEKLWYGVSIGRSHFRINCTISKQKNRIGVELYFDPEEAEEYFELLKENQEEIEESIGSKLEWQRLENKNACRIVIYNRPVEVENREKWEEQFEWLEDNLYSFYETFSERVKNLQLEEA
jgi:hypothetical protein